MTHTSPRLQRPIAPIACLALACLAATSAAAQQSPFSQARQLTASITMDPSLSPDGKRVVYIVVVAGVQQLFTSAVDGSGARQVTHDAFDHEDPAWSHDGRKIAYVSNADAGQVISLMNPDGTGVEALSPRSVHAIHPSWAPDSASVLYCTTDDLDPPRKNESDIYRVDVSSRAVTRLITGGVNTYPSMSPDGLRIAFRKIVDGANSEVFVANANGSNPRNLTHDPAFDGWPAWSPDGSRIAFASNRRGNQQIFVMDADGGNVTPVVHKEGRATAPAWAPDGKALYFPVCAKADGIVGCEIFAARLDAGAAAHPRKGSDAPHMRPQ
ncbi:MAG: LpqB family beta-propeller domain-containing protein [Betaproteobacteria bacterium]